MTKELEARVKVLEDIEAIRKLKATYCDLCDAGLSNQRNVAALLSHFTDDARVDFGMGEGSSFEGKPALEIFFGQVVAGSVSFCMHMVHNSVIEVDGDTATGRWYFEAPTTNAATEKAQWMAGRYEEEYVRRDGEWKFSSIATHWFYVAPYDEGWGNATGDFRARAAGETSD
jgi:ketosteroid isomerase-like protein